ncbi:hypothetical protein XccvBFoX1_gp74c [Xanthomonas phage FoX1]|uniref:Uncharacterized protein n=1 Tax=Xanthomonas phage FoX1 TaxID=2723897 RepID=A0A858NQ62_9CAUD|nr:hypothetical protein KNU93_gp36 [Xanthomonas phage FoX1]QJB21813.1 hypothetical protein XccvBFoX1_gp74c [Xanthomonas phage FoX1]
MIGADRLRHIQHSTAIRARRSERTRQSFHQAQRSITPNHVGDFLDTPGKFCIVVHVRDYTDNSARSNCSLSGMMQQSNLNDLTWVRSKPLIFIRLSTRSWKLP